MHRAVLASLAIMSTGAVLRADEPRPAELVAQWLREQAVPLSSIGQGEADGPVRDLEKRLASVRVVGLGEATHGQRESFEFKRTLTMHLIKHHGVRIVAYEASSSRARACEAYVSGASDDLDAAMSGFGMLIWHVKENEALLKDLRAWNAAAQAHDRVSFVGIDVQDEVAASKRLVELLQPGSANLGARATDAARGLDGAAQKLRDGEPSDYDRLREEVVTIAERCEAIVKGRPEAWEIAVRAKELRLAVERYRSPGSRDRAMAEMLLDELQRRGEKTKATVWAHNGHVTRGSLQYLGTSELGMGGHLGAALGDGYYAVGFAFAKGAFHALAQDDSGAWKFREYRVTGAGPGSLEEPFRLADRGDVIVDLRAASRKGTVEAWLARGHGQTWFGGYNISDEQIASAAKASKLTKTVPSTEFDAIAFFRETTASTPMSESLRWKE